MEKKYKITLFVADLGGGGAERVMVTLANEFSRSGHQVDLVLGQDRGPYLKEVDPIVRIISLGVSKTIYSVFPLIKYLKREKPDVVLSTLLICNIISVLANMLIGSKAKVVLREAISPSAENKFLKWDVERIISFFRKWALKRADAIVAPSYGVAEDLSNVFSINSSKIFVIYNPVDIQKIFAASAEENALIDKLLLDIPVILGIGRLHKQKDFPSLIRAFNEVLKDKNAVLIIIGEGHERKNIEGLIDELQLTDKVYLPGFVENPFPFLKRASVYVMSSLYEGMPNALIQAVVFQKQIVSTTCPSGPSEILDNGAIGCLVNVSDITGLVKGIRKGLNNELSISGMEQIIKRYDSVFIAKEYLKVLLAGK